jgi:hypothetical protein
MGAEYGQLVRFRDSIRSAAAGMTELKRQLIVGEGVYAVKQAKKICKDEEIIDTGNYRNSFHTDPAPVVTPQNARIDVHNGADYASHLEYGHLVVSRGGGSLHSRRRAAMAGGRFVRGKYVLTRAIQRTAATQAARINRKLEAYLRRYFGNEA